MGSLSNVALSIMKKSQGTAFFACADINFPVPPFFSVTAFVTQWEITEMSSNRLHANVQLPLKPFKLCCKFLYARIYIAYVQLIVSDPFRPRY